MKPYSLLQQQLRLHSNIRAHVAVATKYKLSNMCHVGLWGILYKGIEGIYIYTKASALSYSAFDVSYGCHSFSA